MSKKILIVGGVAGGATAAARLRRLSEDDQIIMFEKDEYISFANCGLPYYIGDVITDRSKLLVQTVGGMSKRFNLDIRNFSLVTGIDRDNKQVVVKNLRTNEEYRESYDKLILSPGASPIRPNIPGIKDANNVFVLRNIPNTDDIYNYIKNNNVKKAAVIGGGFIGIEMAENLRHRNIDVTLIDLANQVMAPLDYEMAQIVHQELEGHGVKLVLGDGVKEFKNNGGSVVTNSGKEIDADLIILAIGVIPETRLAMEANLELGETKAIKVNEYLQTSDDDIYAIGDAIEVNHYITGKPTRIPLAWPANRQGVLVANHINGIIERASYKGSLGTSVAKVFNYTVATTGLNEKQLKQLNLEFQSIHINRANHASYYPNATPIVLKLIFNPQDGSILGAQAVGQEGTEKRIDVIATAIKGNLKVYDLADLELSYAPPFGSAKDPVNIAGYVATNIYDGVYKMVHWNEVESKVSEGAFLLDVRTPIEFDLGSIAGSTNIELDSLRNNLDKLPKDKPIIVTCQIGLRGYLAIRILQENGFTNLYNLSGGYHLYSIANNLDQNNNNNDVDTQSATVDNDNEDDSLIDIKETINVDACGLQCPGPILETYKAIEKLKDGEVLKVTASDPGFYRDVDKWCKKTGNTIVDLKKDSTTVTALIQKGQKVIPTISELQHKDSATIVLFSGEYDKAMAAMIIANGAAAMGKKVSIFFTFWGLNALRRKPDEKLDKSAVENMFGAMMPMGADKLPLSNMHMAGMGKAMMNKVMKDKNVESLSSLMNTAKEMGVNFIACTMSMDVMGIKSEELIDGIELGGVATYLAESDDANLTLFI